MSSRTAVPQNDLLVSLKIAAPCNVSWESMTGDDRVRHCQQCNKNVYNISSMTKVEANEFLQATANMACVNFFRRTDGTILVDNCPVGLRKIRDQYKRLAAAAGTLISLGAGLIMSALADDLGVKQTSNGSPTNNPMNPTNNFLRGKPVALPSRLGGEPVQMGGAPIPQSNRERLYRSQITPLITTAMPNRDLGHAALTLSIEPSGHIKRVNLFSKSPNKDTDELIINAVKNLQLPPLPSDYHQSELSMYYECHEARK